MSALQFPLDFKFNISTFSNDFTATDASGQTLAYVRQKMFKFKEDIQIFTDRSKSEQIYSIKADKWLDFSTSYKFTNSVGEELGKIARKGWRSLWKATYEIVDDKQELQFHVNEHNAWVKVMDGLFSEIPILGIFTGYLFNPSYDVKDLNGNLVFKLKKVPSFFGRKFTVEKLSDEVNVADGQRIMLGLMMLVLLERRRG